MTYNIISNNCVGAAIYVELDKQFNNPFTWGFIDADNFIALIENYDRLNYNNYRIEKSDLDEEYKDSYMVVIDDKIKYHYIHYIQNDNYENPTKLASITGQHSRDILGKHMKEYTNDKYLKRLNRMLEEDIEPIFFVSLSKYTPRKRLYDIIKIKTNYKIVILLPEDFDLMNTEIPENVELIYNTEHAKWTNAKAKFVLNRSKYIHK